MRQPAPIDPPYDVDPAAAAVVAEAVALAAEAAAAEAAEAVRLTTTSVAVAAARAARAAEDAREARRQAAETAARSLVVEAARTADAVRSRADLAADRVDRAAVLAAAQLGRPLADGTTPDRRQLAVLLAETVLAAAQAAARETTRAADDVVAAAAAAAEVVSRSVAVADVVARREADSAAGARRELAAQVAAGAALETHVRASGIATTAHDAARMLARGRPVGDSDDVRSRAAQQRLAEVSHDLRVPLTALLAGIELLEDRLAPGDVVGADLLARAARAGDRMTRMLDHHLSPPHEDVTPVRADLDEVARHVVADLAGLLARTRATVEVGPLPVLDVDADDLYSVVQNLLVNAIKFARDRVAPTIRLSARRTKLGWRVSMHDDGIGLPDDHGLDVFAQFSRGTGVVAGHGIGLATVARIVRAHGGRVGAESAEGGTEVWFELPAPHDDPSR